MHASHMITARRGKKVNVFERILNFKLIGQKHIINLNLHRVSKAKSFFPFDHHTASSISSVKGRIKQLTKMLNKIKLVNFILALEK